MVSFRLNAALCLALPLVFSILSMVARGAECPPGTPVGIPCLEAWETVDLEHNDRIARLTRLAGGTLSFEFYAEYIEPSDHELEAFPVQIPVLRIVAGQDVFFDSGKD